MATKTVADINVAGKAVLMRVDFNVPIKNGKVANDRRIAQALPTIKRLVDQGGKLILMSHLGRPAENGYEADFSLAPAAERLAQLLGKPVKLGAPSIAGPEMDPIAAAMNAGDVVLLENVRFNPGETIMDKAKKNPDKKLTPEQQKINDDFVASLARLGEVYVNDAFGTCHRKHASMYGVPKAIQKKGGPAVAGFLVEKEIKYLDEALKNPKTPFVAVLGGAKVSDKIKLISKLLEKVDRILIGGAMAYTLLKSKGVAVGKSLVEADQVEPMKDILAKAGDKIMLPCDHVATDKFDFKKKETGPATPLTDVNIPESLMGMDIGPKTIAAYEKVLLGAGTIVWNGPMGVFEVAAFAAGTKAVANAIANATGKGAISVIGGGDSATAVEEMGLDTKMTHVSTGGGASLEYLEGKAMPPLEVLDKN
ncbi:MAG: phosphoglycerate kinase [Candidatus Sumerlaeota bacterium]|nr:phosphoglycerate kinase [Candidatus Sumerlaeota bacterium]